jgi:hypothetical protein
MTSSRVPGQASGEMVQTSSRLSITYFVDENEQLYSSNAIVFPASGFNQSIDGRLHIPRFANDSIPYQPFYPCDSRQIRKCDLISSLGYEPLHKISVVQHEGGFIGVHHAEWQTLENFVERCLGILGQRVPVYRMLNTVVTAPASSEKYTQPSSTEQEARQKVFHARRKLTFAITKLSFYIFMFDRLRRSSNEASWFDRLSSSDIVGTSVIGNDGTERTGLQALEEIRHTFIARFHRDNMSTRVGCFIDPYEQMNNAYTTYYLQAHIPVYFVWGSQRDLLLKTRRGLPAPAYIPPEGLDLATAKQVVARPTSAYVFEP